MTDGVAELLASGVAPGRHAGRVAVVTGGTSGIGLATAARLRAEGAQVVIAGRDPVRGEAAVEQVHGSAPADGQPTLPAVRFVATDVTDRDQLVALYDEVAALGRLDLVVNAAGAIVVAPFATLSPRHWQRSIDLNLTAVYASCQLALPLLKANVAAGRTAAIVNVTSLDAVGGDRGMTAYNAAKAGALNFTRALALELAPLGIRVNAVSPGAVDTPMVDAVRASPALHQVFCEAIPLGRMGRPHEIAAAVCFLGADEAAFVTGANLMVDGGVTSSTGHPDLMQAFGLHP